MSAQELVAWLLTLRLRLKCTGMQVLLNQHGCPQIVSASFSYGRSEDEHVDHVNTHLSIENLRLFFVIGGAVLANEDEV